jgi:hypothetical protein
MPFESLSDYIFRLSMQSDKCFDYKVKVLLLIHVTCPFDTIRISSKATFFSW